MIISDKTFNISNKVSYNLKGASVTSKISQSNYGNDYEEIDYSDGSFYEINDLVKEKYSVVDYNKIENDGFKVQGITVVNNIAYITAYTNAKGVNSRLYAYDLSKEKNDALKGIIILDQESHVGGTTFDKENNILYVTDNKNFTTYDYSVIEKSLKEAEASSDKTYKLKTINNIELEDFEEKIIASENKELIDLLNKSNPEDLFESWQITKSHYHDAKYLEEVNNGDHLDDAKMLDDKTFGLINSYLNKYYGNAIMNNIKTDIQGSTTYFYNGTLYVSLFNASEDGKLQKIKTKIIEDEYHNKYIVADETEAVIDGLPNLIQGLIVTEYKGQEYMLFSRSLFNPMGSSIVVYKKNADGSYSNEGIHYIKDLGLEGMEINEHGQIVAVGEKYLKTNIPIDVYGISDVVNQKQETIVLNMDDILSNLQEYDDTILEERINKIAAVGYKIKGEKGLLNKVKKFIKVGKEDGAIDGNLIAGIVYTLTNAPKVVTGAVGSLVLNKVLDTIVPDSIKNDGTGSVVYNSTKNLIDTFLVKNNFVTSAEIIEDGIIAGIIQGPAKQLNNTGAAITKFGASSLIGGGKLFAKIGNKLGLDINLSKFDAAAKKTDEIIDKAYNYIDKKIDQVGDIVEDAVDAVVDTGKKVVNTSCKWVKKAWNYIF